MLSSVIKQRVQKEVAPDRRQKIKVLPSFTGLCPHNNHVFFLDNQIYLVTITAYVY